MTGFDKHAAGAHLSEGHRTCAAATVERLWRPTPAEGLHDSMTAFIAVVAGEAALHVQLGESAKMLSKRRHANLSRGPIG